MNIWKPTFHLVIIYSLLFTAFFLTSEIFSIGLPFRDVIYLLTASLLISLFTLYFFARGKNNEEKNSALYTLAAIGIKMVLYLILILIFYILSKIEGSKFIITFFVIYLSFTGYLIKLFIKTLKTNKADK